MKNRPLAICGCEGEKPLVAFIFGFVVLAWQPSIEKRWSVNLKVSAPVGGRRVHVWLRWLQSSSVGPAYENKETAHASPTDLTEGRPSS